MIQKTLHARDGLRDITVIQTGPVIEVAAEGVRLVIDRDGEVFFEPGWARDALSRSWWADICKVLGFGWQVAGLWPRTPVETRDRRVRYLGWIISGDLVIPGLGKKSREELAMWLELHPDGGSEW